MFIDFIYENWRIIVEVIILIISIVLFCVRKKQVSSVLADINEASIVAIQSVEKTNLKGSDKLSLACDMVKAFLKKIYPKINVDSYTSSIINVIESILDTPQKK